VVIADCSGEPVSLRSFATIGVRKWESPDRANQ
jgi:hypothetical protein